jgi:hypothetical protein
LATFNSQLQHGWSRGFSSTSVPLNLTAISLDSSGNIAVTGAFRGEVDFGAGPIAGAGDSISLLAAKFDQSGNPLWIRPVGGGIYHAGTHLSTSPTSDLVLTGASTGAVDFGTGPLGASGETSTFIAKLGR